MYYFFFGVFLNKSEKSVNMSGIKSVFSVINLTMVGAGALVLFLLIKKNNNVTKESPKYIIHENRASFGTSLGEQHKNFIGDYPHLREMCDKAADCVGFTGSGWLKSQIDQPSEWINSDYDMWVKL